MTTMLKIAAVIHVAAVFWLYTHSLTSWSSHLSHEKYRVIKHKSIYLHLWYIVCCTLWLFGFIHSTCPIQLNVKVIERLKVVKRRYSHGPRWKRASEPLYLHWAWNGMYQTNLLIPSFCSIESEYLQCEKAFTVWLYHVAKARGHSKIKIQTYFFESILKMCRFENKNGCV